MTPFAYPYEVTSPALHLSVAGSGARDALFLPGIGHFGDHGRPIADGLRGTHTTYLADLPGTGRSPATTGMRHLADVVPVIERTLDDRGIDRLDVIGHSLGGMVGIEFALARPRRVRSLTLLDSGYWRVPRMPFAMMGPLGALVPAVNLAHHVVGDRIFWGKPANAHQPGATFDHEQDLAEITAAAGSFLMAAYRARPAERLRQVTVPCLLVYGRRGIGVEREAAARSAGTQPNVSVIGLQGGHDVHRDDPATVDVVRRFLED